MYRLSIQKKSALLGLFIAVGCVLLGCYLYGATYATYASMSPVPDAKEYKQLGEALLHGRAVPVALLEMRGYFYAICANMLASLSPALLVLYQVVAVSVGAIALAEAEHLMTSRIRWTWLVLLCVSLMLAPANMMTEAQAFCFASLALVFFVRGVSLCGSSFLWLAAMTKYSFLPVAILATAMSLKKTRGGVFHVVFILVLLLPQLLLTAHYGEGPGLSGSGALNFNERFFPAVAGVVEKGHVYFYTSEEAIRVRKEYPALTDQLAYVIKHPLHTVYTWAYLMYDSHLFTYSGYASVDNQAADHHRQKDIEQLSTALNVVMVLAASLGLAGIIRTFRHSARPVRIAMMMGPSLIVTAPLVYWQGDRVIFIGLVLLLPFCHAGLLFVKQQMARLLPKRAS